MTDSKSRELSSNKAFNRLRAYNAVMGGLHALQAIAVLTLANDFTIPVTANYPQGPPGTLPDVVTTVFDVPLGIGVAVFLTISSLAHFFLVTPMGFRIYRTDLRRKRNTARWVEYSVSATLMMLLIAQLCGITDVAALLAIGGVNASMILFGWLQERYVEPGSRQWLPFTFGSIAGIVPWLAIAIYVLAPGSNSAATPPGFVYGIIVSLFVFFNVFALNQWLQYKQVGRWRDYIFGEKVYVALSLTAKSALAWQVFAGTLAG